MAQAAGSVLPTAACQLQSAVEASSTIAVTLCSNEATPIVTCANPFGTLPTSLPPVLPRSRRQNSAVHPFQNDDDPGARKCKRLTFFYFNSVKSMLLQIQPKHESVVKIFRVFKGFRFLMSHVSDRGTSERNQFCACFENVTKVC